MSAAKVSIDVLINHRFIEDYDGGLAALSFYEQQAQLALSLAHPLTQWGKFSTSKALRSE